MFSNLTGFRTYLAAALVTIFGALAVLDWNVILNDPTAGLVAIGSAILMAIMRSITTTPPGSKE